VNSTQCYEKGIYSSNQMEKKIRSLNVTRV